MGCEEKSMLMLWQQRMLNSFIDGISSVLPAEIFSIFTGEELRDLFCGNPDIDVDMLRRVVEYEGYKESDKVIEFFWEILREFTNEERKRFLQFVWARNRLPLKSRKIMEKMETKHFRLQVLVSSPYHSRSIS